MNKSSNNMPFVSIWIWFLNCVQLRGQPWVISQIYPLGQQRNRIGCKYWRAGHGNWYKAQGSTNLEAQMWFIHSFIRRVHFIEYFHANSLRLYSKVFQIHSGKQIQNQRLGHAEEHQTNRNKCYIRIFEKFRIRRRELFHSGYSFVDVFRAYDSFNGCMKSYIWWTFELAVSGPSDVCILFKYIELIGWYSHIMITTSSRSRKIKCSFCIKHNEFICASDSSDQSPNASNFQSY